MSFAISAATGGYRQANQVGSHVILVSDQPIHHRLPVPRHNPLGIGIFRKILNEVCEAKGIPKPNCFETLAST